MAVKLLKYRRISVHAKSQINLERSLSVKLHRGLICPVVLFTSPFLPGGEKGSTLVFFFYDAKIMSRLRSRKTRLQGCTWRNEKSITARHERQINMGQSG